MTCMTRQKRAHDACCRRRVAYSTGIITSVTSIDNLSPPITAIASGFCNSAPAAIPNANGKSPKSVQSVVMRIGRTPIRPAAPTLRPLVRSLEAFVIFEQDDSVLHHQPNHHSNEGPMHSIL